ncbi:carbamoyltransferase family protein [Rhodoplanes sp. Z2-YC6860]|uniref:carbamoyltransferase family protein n=1 Tax=Rhodoplanes sp. Z2-YC6860 TaxID=674703 RepID=UPI00078B7B8B|nr:carbamoyltransferase C-terminal domain-containing protein [Rhodoplanes sp. Z2-YC6860]AMN43744.1 Carbamoyltransferase [Rhodoplanes sp. Z2-YC6860]
MIILGLNAFHGDSAAALICDGRLIAAAEEERFRRVKHWAGFPTQAITYCLHEAGIDLADVTHVTINQDSSRNLLRKFAYALRHRPSASLVANRIRNRRARLGIPELLGENFPDSKFRGELHPVEHHLSHLSSAFHVSPFREAVVASVDGFGDFASAAWGIGRGTEIAIDGRVYFPHSLGIFYQALTQYLGFPHYGDEYKVMGLAPYGKPVFMEAMRQIIALKPNGSYALDLKYFRHHRETVAYQWAGGPPQTSELFAPALEQLLGPRRAPDEPLEERHRDMARSVQEMYEEAFFHLICRLYESYGCDELALAGGCAMNSVANGKVRRMTPFRRVYVQSAAGDAGGAIGSAFALWHKLGGERSFVMNHAYWGPKFDRDSVEQLVATRRNEISNAGCEVEEIRDEPKLLQKVSEAIVNGKVVGWFQGRMEWGPRALGNRSILCDPRRADIKDVLNLKIKRRESFRPFAPSILEECVHDWFEENDAVPFMMQVFQVRREKRHLIPAVTHVDGSGRLQTVSRDANRRYHALIERFCSVTGIPMLLNTSFNENEPVVCTPKEALDCFLRTKMDILVIGDTMLRRADDK